MKQPGKIDDAIYKIARKLGVILHPSDSIVESLNEMADRMPEIGEGLPKVTTTDNGKVLMVVNGAWAAQHLDNAEEASY